MRERHRLLPVMLKRCIVFVGDASTTTSQECGCGFLFMTTKDILLFGYAVKLKGAVCPADNCYHSMRFVIISCIHINVSPTRLRVPQRGEKGGGSVSQVPMRVIFDMCLLPRYLRRYNHFE